MVQLLRKTVAVLLLNVFLTSLVGAQYGSPVNNGNPGYGGTGVPSGDYGHKSSVPSGGGGASDGASEPEPFNFSYQVKDAPTYTDFKHEANSDGKRVTGSYSVLLPDGRNQVVTYVADENGYNAKVNYEGEAKPQPAGPGGYSPGSGYPSPAPGGYPSASGYQPSKGYPSAAPSYSSSAPSYPSSAPAGYPSSAPSYPSSAPSYPSSAPSYPSSAPSYPSPAGYPSAGIKGSYAAPQPKNGGY